MKEKLAVVGSGISGISAAYYLSPHFDLTLFEKEDYLGGHTNTLFVDEGEESIAIDTGFMVFNEDKYPSLMKLFREIDVHPMDTSMSLSIKDIKKDLEYRGSNLKTLFAKKRNLLDHRFLKMLLEIFRFMRIAKKVSQKKKYYSPHITVNDFLNEYRFSYQFIWFYLIPLTAAIWSCSPSKMMNFPLVSVVVFLDNHGLIDYFNFPVWKTLKGGSQTYYQQILKKIEGKVEKNLEVIQIRRVKVNGGNQVEVVFKNQSQQERRRFDKVVLATHADQALRLYQDLPTEHQKILSHFNYQSNQTILHTDASVMPKRKTTWASWNVAIDRDHDHSQVSLEQQFEKIRFSTTYYMNSLQKVSKKKHYFVTLNPFDEIDPKKVIKILNYFHPILDAEAVRHQSQLPSLNENGEIFFTGSYFGYGFHEDALKSSIRVCEKILQRPLYS